MRKFSNILAFYKSLALTNLAISTAAGIIGGYDTFAFGFLALGFVLAVALKEVNSRSEYIFYRNNGLERIQLWVFAYVLNIAAFLVATTIFIVCKIMF